MTQNQGSKNTLLVAVLAGLPTLALLGWVAPAHAQYQVGGNGHALDANPQVGSGGINGGGAGANSARINNQVLNSAIITGNVSGLNYFHGNNNREINPNVFDGRVGTAPSDFLNYVVGPTVGANGTHVEQQQGSLGVTPVYSTSSYVGAPQPGLNPAVSPNGDLVIPAPRIDPLSQVNDSREDVGHDLNSNPDLGAPMTVGELTSINSVDASGNPSMYSSYSPLYGVRQMQTNPDDSFYQSKFGATAVNPNGTPLTPSAIQKMRDELNNNPVSNDDADQINKPVPGSLPIGQTSLSSTVGAANQALPDPALNSSLKDQALPGGVNSGQGMQNELKVAPAQQSAQLKALQRRYAQSNQKLDAMQQTQRFNEQLRANAQKDTGTGAGNTVTPPPTGVTPDNTGVAPLAKPDDNAPPKPGPILNGSNSGTAGNDTSAIDNKPLIITSLATGIPAGGFADLMKTAEEKMRQGKFTEAVASYESAEQVVRNNPFVYLGRAFAELGSSYYGKADLDIRRAVLIDPAVLAGRYDLNGFLGQERVRFIDKELNDISGHESGARAFVLLAFLAHNAGNDALAASDLETAFTRGGYSGLVAEMRKAWGIAAATPAAK
jgi:hypothetical protein